MLSNLKIGTKIVGAFVFVALVMIGLGAFVSGRLGELSDANTKAYEKITVPIGEMVDLAMQTQRARSHIRDALFARDARGMADDLKKVEERQTESLATLKELEKTLFSDEGRKLHAALEADLRNVYADYAEIEKRLNAGKRDEAVAFLIDRAAEKETVARKKIEDYRTLKGKLGKQTANENLANAKATKSTSWGVIGVLALACLGLGLVLAKMITAPLKKMMEVAQALAKGDVDQEIAHRSKDETGMLADSFRDTLAYIQDVAKGAEALAAGDLSVKLAPKSAEDVLTKNFVKAVDTVRSMSEETQRLIGAAKAGKLAMRGDATKFQGAYSEIVRGVNEMLDAVIGPLNVAAEYVDRISRGDIPAKITDKYEGDFNEIKNNLNVCIDAVNALVTDANLLSSAAVDGKLSTRADANKHQGDFRKVVEGVNKTLDAVIGPLNVAAEYVERISRGDIPAKITDKMVGWRRARMPRSTTGTSARSWRE